MAGNVVLDQLHVSRHHLHALGERFDAGELGRALWLVAERFDDGFGEALGHEPERPAKFAGIEALPKRVQVMAADVQLVKDYIARHCDA